MSEFEDIERLLRLKRYERPPEDFYDQFAADFKERQRAEMLRLSARGLLVERVSTWMWGFGPRHWIAAGGAVSAMAVGAGFFIVPGMMREDETPPGEADPVVAGAEAELDPDVKPEEKGSKKLKTADLTTSP